MFALVGLLSLKTFIFEFVRLLYFCYNSQMNKEKMCSMEKEKSMVLIGLYHNQ